MLKRGVTSLLFILVSVLVFAQYENKLRIYGKVTYNDKNLESANVDLYQFGEQVEGIITNNSGRFEFILDLETEYSIEITKPNFITKVISINTSGSDPNQALYGYEFGGWEVGIYKDFKELDKTVLEAPIAIIEYSEEIQNFDYNIKYTRKILDKLETLQAKAEELEKNQELQGKKLEEDYNGFIKDGDKAFNAGQWEKAQTLYADALELKNLEAYPKQKLKEIDERIASAKALDEKYQNVIAQADLLFQNDRYQEAKLQYQEAILLKNNETYPKQKIIEADQRINDLLVAQKQKEAAEKQKQENFNQLFSSASGFLETGNFNQAKESAELALKEFPENTEAKKLLLEIEDNIEAKKAAKAAELLAQKEEDKRKQAEAKKLAEDLNKLVAEAEEFRLNGDLSNAKAKYVEAKKFGKNTSSIDLKIKEIDGLIEEENRQNVFYQNQLSLAQVLIEKKDYKNALTKLNQINSDFPDRKTTVEKIDFVNGILTKQSKEEEEAFRLARIEEEKENARKLDLQYKGYINSGNDLFNKGLYEQALAKYKLASEIKPEENEAPQKMYLVQQKIEEKLATLAKSNTQEEIKATSNSKKTGKLDLKEDPDVITEEFLSQLSKEYPEGVTEVIYTKGNKEITKRVVIIGGQGAVYRKVKHNWGGEFFFKNNDPVTKFIWDKETVL